MEVKATDPSKCGTVTFGEPVPICESFPGDPSRVLTGSRAAGEWRPPERLEPFLPEGFRVPLYCYVGADGLRRIVPACNFEELIDLGAVGGRAVIHGIRGFDQESENYSRMAHLIHQYVCGRRYRRLRGMQEHITRHFDHARDLFVRRSGRCADSERDVLPEDLGLTARGEGRRLGVTELTKRGREAARVAHYCNPTSKTSINFGLYEAARLNPLEAANKEVPGLVKSALFDVEPLGDPPSEELIGHVTRRLWNAVRAHESDSSDSFYKWFAGPDSSLVKQLAQQKSQPGGKLSRDDVRRVLLHLAMQEAFQYVGQCVRALMRTIKLAIPEPLNAREKELYEHMHESQPYYGDVPAAMLVDRMEDVRRAVLAIWNEPQNPEHVRVLHRLLAYYSEMAKRRRQADKQSKNRPLPVEQEQTQKIESVATVETRAEQPLVEKHDQAAQTVSKCGPVRLHEASRSPTIGKGDPFDIIGESIRELCKIECPADCSQWEYHRDGESLEVVMIRLRCECGQIDRIVTMAMDEFVEQAEKSLGCRRKPSTAVSEAETASDGHG